MNKNNLKISISDKQAYLKIFIVSYFLNQTEQLKLQYLDSVYN